MHPSTISVQRSSDLLNSSKCFQDTSDHPKPPLVYDCNSCAIDCIHFRFRYVRALSWTTSGVLRAPRDPFLCSISFFTQSAQRFRSYCSRLIVALPFKWIRPSSIHHVCTIQLNLRSHPGPHLWLYLSAVECLRGEIVGQRQPPPRPIATHALGEEMFGKATCLLHIFFRPDHVVLRVLKATCGANLTSDASFHDTSGLRCLISGERSPSV